MQNLSDEELMLSYQKGEALVMDELLRRYRNPIYRYAFRLSLNAQEAQDITQEVFLRVHQYRESFAGEGKFRPWLYSIAHNLCVSRLRRNKWFVLWPRRNDDPNAQMDFASSDPSPQENASKEELAEVVKKCIQSLPFLQKEALVLREYEGLDYREIAGILKKSPNTIKTLIFRARQKLKEKLLPFIEEVKGGI